MKPFDQTTVPMVEVMGPGEHIGYTRIDATFMPPAQLQPAGGLGPLTSLPVAIDALVQEVATTNELLRELTTLLAAALSP